ncbi:MAG: hypothetical protein DCC49_08820 [Acidobacteria bacterium]|nr:MAG: hypothetical protein DCC49_08820 [Acidobacteriota bacterium]
MGRTTHSATRHRLPSRPSTRPTLRGSRLAKPMRLPIRLGSANARRAHGFGSVAMPVLALVALLLPASANSRVAQPDAFSQSLSASQAMARVPVSFEPNAGQFDPQVKFVARHAGPTVFFTQSEAVFVFSKSADAGAPDARAEIESEPAEQSVVRMGFSDANTNAEIEASGAQEGVSNYLIGSNPAAWRTNVPNYSRITYQQIYDGIDLTFYENDHGRFEYDFIVAPGADPGRIAVKYEANGQVSIGESGELSIPTTQGVISWAAPVSYQDGSALVNSAYVLRAENEVGFEVGDYDPSQTLVLDPQLDYSTYLGGGGSDEGKGIATDSSGRAYVVGYTSSTNFPTAYPFQGSNAGSNDVFVTKFNAAGSSPVFSTYLGGSANDIGWGISVDSAGSAYVTGQTASTNFPTASPYQASNAGTTDVFIAKVNPVGSGLYYSTYLGGSSLEVGLSISVDSAGSAYLTGYTWSSAFPTASPYQASIGSGSPDAFVTKFNAAGSSLTYSTYLGGNGGDNGYGIAVDSTGSAYVAGYTSSTNFPTASPYQAANAGSSDVFVTKFNAAGSSLTYSTYLGGSGNDYGNGIAVDSTGSAYVTGYTISTNFPTASPYQASNGGSSDVFLAKITNIIAISGTFAGGTSGSISVYDLSGNLVTYWCCMSSETWSVPVPQSAVCPTNGYRVLWSPADTTKRATWYNSKASWGSADVVCSPSSGNDMTVTAAGALSGYVKNASTAADLDGAVVYAFDASTGEYEGYGVSGEAGTGRFQVLVASPGSYKLLIAPPPGYVGQWYSGSHNYGDATAVAVPSSTANFSLEPASSISGYVKDMYTAADLNGYPVYVYTTGGEFFGQAVTNSGFGPGRYQFSATSGSSYKLVSEGGPYSTQWWSGASGFGSASATIAPATANFSLGA